MSFELDGTWKSVRDLADRYGFNSPYLQDQKIDYILLGKFPSFKMGGLGGNCSAGTIYKINSYLKRYKNKDKCSNALFISTNEVINSIGEWCRAVTTERNEYGIALDKAINEYTMYLYILEIMYNKSCYGKNAPKHHIDESNRYPWWAGSGHRISQWVLSDRITRPDSNMLINVESFVRFIQSHQGQIGPIISSAPGVSTHHDDEYHCVYTYTPNLEGLKELIDAHLSTLQAWDAYLRLKVPRHIIQIPEEKAKEAVAL
jgi:hypothetical protein